MRAEFQALRKQDLVLVWERVEMRSVAEPLTYGRDSMLLMRVRSKEVEKNDVERGGDFILSFGVSCFRVADHPRCGCPTWTAKDHQGSFTSTVIKEKVAVKEYS